MYKVIDQSKLADYGFRYSEKYHRWTKRLTDARQVFHEKPFDASYIIVSVEPDGIITIRHLWQLCGEHNAIYNGGVDIPVSLSCIVLDS